MSANASFLFSISESVTCSGLLIDSNNSSNIYLNKSWFSSSVHKTSAIGEYAIVCFCLSNSWSDSLSLSLEPLTSDILRESCLINGEFLPSFSWFSVPARTESASLRFTWKVLMSSSESSSLTDSRLLWTFLMP